MTTKVIVQPDAKGLLAMFAGPDGAVDVEIRQSIAEEFAKRHLKGIANEPFFQDAVKRFQQELLAAYNTQIAAEIGVIRREWTGGEHAYKLKLTPEFEAAFTRLVDTAARELVDRLVAQALDERMGAIAARAIERAEQRMNAKIDAGIEAAIRRGIAARLDAAAKLGA